LTLDRHYPEREDARLPAADRLLAGVAWRWQTAFAREVAPEPLGEPPADLPRLCYALRRDGFTPETTRQALAAACAALEAVVPAHVLSGARALVEGGIVELADAGERRGALSLAALARALRGEPVHWLAASERQAAMARETLRPALERLGLGADAVRCAVVREVAFDYLRDRLQLGPRVRRLQGMTRPSSSPRSRISPATGCSSTRRGSSRRPCPRRTSSSRTKACGSRPRGRGASRSSACCSGPRGRRLRAARSSWSRRSAPGTSGARRTAAPTC
jgi:hypothetical protein